MDYATKTKFTSDPNTPPAVLKKFAGSKKWLICNNLAENPSTPPEVLAKLAENGGEVIRWRVAGNLSTPTETLAQLAADEEWVGSCCYRLQLQHTT